MHNKHVVDSLREKGAVFVEELDEIPANHTDRPVIFSAHGVPKSVPADAEQRNMFYIDATCPLVTKVHNEAARHHLMGYDIILIGHAGHPEVVGTIGQLPEGAVFLIETIEDVERFTPPRPDKLAYCSQTTLSVDDTAEIVGALKQKFPSIIGPSKEDICYATTNRQDAVRQIAPQVDAVLVIGSPNSSNSKRLVEVAQNNGCDKAFLVQDSTEIPWDDITGIGKLGLTAGASAPDILIQNVLTALSTRFNITVREEIVARENIIFNIPKILRNQEERNLH